MIETLEKRIAEMTAAMNEPEFFRQSADAIVSANEAMAKTQAELDVAYTRWQELEAASGE